MIYFSLLGEDTALHRIVAARDPGERNLLPGKGLGRKLAVWAARKIVAPRRSAISAFTTARPTSWLGSAAAGSASMRTRASRLLLQPRWLTTS